MRIAVIGAGIAALSLVTLLNRSRPDLNVVLFEKSRGVGGRMATRYTETHAFDHGAQFFTARTGSFQDFLAPYLETGLVQPWEPRITNIAPDGSPDRRPWFDAHYVAQPRMTSLCKKLAAGVDVRLGCAVDNIERSQSGWQLTAGNLIDETFDWIVSTAPAEQTSNLLPVDFSEVTFDPAFALMLALEEAPIFDAAVVKHPDIEWLAMSSSKPGRDTLPSLVAHSSGQYAKRRFNDDRHDIEQDLAERVFELTGITAKNRQLQRWKYAKVTKPWHSPCFLSPDSQLAACGDWMIGGKVEDAFTSAETLAGKLLAQFS